MKNLDVEIMTFYIELNRNKAWKDIRAGNSKSLWKSIKILRDVNVEPIPKKLLSDGNPIDIQKKCDVVGEFSNEKVKKIERSTLVQPWWLGS